MPNLDDTLLDFDRRLQDLEEQITKTAGANRSGNSRFSRAGLIPPRVGGLVAVPNVKTITWNWNQSPVEDLAYYIVDVADNASMAGLTSFQVIDNSFTYQDGASNTTYYARVKAYTRSKKTGPASVIVSNTTGQADANDIADSSIGLTKTITGDILNYVALTGSPAYTVTGTLAPITGASITVVFTSARQVAELLVTFGGTSTLVGTPTAAQNIVGMNIEYGVGASPSSWTVLVTANPARIPTGGVGIGGGPPTTPHSPGIGTFTYRVNADYTNKNNAGDTLVIDTVFMRAFRYGV